jgi:hypothetical protein
MGISACREAGHWEVAMALLHSAARNIELFGMLGDASKQSQGNNAAICCNLYVYIYIYIVYIYIVCIYIYICGQCFE